MFFGTTRNLKIERALFVSVTARLLVPSRSPVLQRFRLSPQASSSPIFRKCAGFACLKNSQAVALEESNICARVGLRLRVLLGGRKRWADFMMSLYAINLLVFVTSTTVYSASVAHVVSSCLSRGTAFTTTPPVWKRPNCQNEIAGDRLRAATPGSGVCVSQRVIVTMRLFH